MRSLINDKMTAFQTAAAAAAAAAAVDVDMCGSFLLDTSDPADDLLFVDLAGLRINNHECCTRQI